MTTFHILLVDDEMPFIETLAQRLRQRGFAVDCAFSGIEALNQLDTDIDVDVVVMDIKMPGMDGIETVKKIKHQHPLVEIIMLTGHATIHSAVDAIKFGAIDYLTKPCDLALLISKATQAATRKREREAKIFDVRTKPYITTQEREEMIAKILENRPD